MKRVELVKTIEQLGCVLIRHGGRHNWYRNPMTGVSQPLPRHWEIKANLVLAPSSACFAATANALARD